MEKQTERNGINNFQMIPRVYLIEEIIEETYKEAVRNRRITAKKGQPFSPASVLIKGS